MANNPAPFIDGPIPGQGLTFELGNRPWQNPPQYTTVEETLEYYIPRLVEPEFVDELMNVMEMGVPLTTIANAMQVGGVMQGLHTVDIGVLVIPVLIEMMAYIGDSADIKYNTGMEEESRRSKMPKASAISVAMKKAKERMEKETNNLEETGTVTKEEPMEVAEEPSTGLMARRA